MMRLRRFFASMVGRLFVILLLGMSVAAIGATMLASAKRQQEFERQNLNRIADRLQGSQRHQVVRREDGIRRRRAAHEISCGLRSVIEREPVRRHRYVRQPHARAPSPLLKASMAVGARNGVQRAVDEGDTAPTSIPWLVRS